MVSDIVLITAYETELLGAEFLVLALGHFFGRDLKNLANSEFFAEHLEHGSVKHFSPFKGSEVFNEF